MDIKKFSHSSLGKLISVFVGLMLIVVVSNAMADSLLSDAIFNNDLAKTKLLISLGADVNQKNQYGNPIIHSAASRGNPEILELLISKGADVNAKGKFDRVALHYASKKGIAKILLEHGAIVDAPTNYGETPLHWAAQGVNGMEKEVDLLEFAEVLISHGADVNRKAGEGRSFKTALNYAAESNNLPVAKLLIANGADVEGGGSPALGSAGVNGDYVEMAQLLIENGAKVNSPSPSGWHPVQTAAGRGNIKVMNYLLDHGADPNATDQLGMSALYTAASSDYNVVVTESLLSHGANPNAKNIYGGTALDQAASQGAVKIVELLLANGADVNTRTKMGFTPLHVAISYGKNDTRMNVVEVLLKHGADVNAKTDDDCETPFHKAVSRGNIEIVKLLLEHGADVNAASKYGVRPLYFARDSIALSELLKEHGAN